nr:hypothetical protein [Tanacetum cinerariifolium]
MLFSDTTKISPSPSASTSKFFVAIAANKTTTRVVLVSKSSSSSGDDSDDVITRGTGTTAKGRRLLKVREEKRKREFDRLNNYPSWAKVLENAAKNDVELRNVLGDTIGNPDQMRRKVEDRIRNKGRDFHRLKQDQSCWQIHQWNTILSMMWITAVISFHDIGDVEFQDNWFRVWVDIGTSNYFTLDVLLNGLTVLSSEYFGIQQVVFGGRSMGDWEEGMKNPKDGYESFKI